MGRGTHGEGRDGLLDHRGSPGRVGDPESETGRETHREVRDRLGTHREVRDGLGETRGGPGQVGGPLTRFGTVHCTLGDI